MAAPSTSDDDATRRSAVAWAVALTAGLPLAPKRYERHLLERCKQGELSIDEVIALLDKSVYKLLYRSHETNSMSTQMLQELLEQSRDFNALHNITGLLLYSKGNFVQMLEGDEAPVRHLYSRIQQDTRHTQVVTLSEGPGTQRSFANWNMAFGQVPMPVLNKVLDAVESFAPTAVPMDDPRLQALLGTFGLLEPWNIS